VHLVQEIAAHAVYALSLQSLVEKVGAYAGFAAVVGLAVLTALYFSQARDVKRLREWAGRAPERSAEMEAGGRTPQAAAVRTGQPPATGTVGQAQPVARPAQGAPGQAAAGGAAVAGAAAAATAGQQGAKPATAPGAKPAVAPAGAQPAPATASAGNSGGAAAGKGAATPAGVAASAAGAAPATATAAKTGGTGPGQPAAGGTGPATAGQPATAAGAGSAGGAQPAAGGQQTAGTPSASAATQAKPGTGTGASGASGAAQGGAATQPKPAAAQGATTAPVRGTTGGAKVLPARPTQPTRPRPIPSPAGAGGNTAVIPPPKTGRNWTAPRYLVLIVAGVIVLGLGGVVGFLALTDNDNGPKKKSPSVALPNGSNSTKTTTKKKEKKNFPPAIDPATVTVAVLNGTQVTGLASSTGQKVSAAGFRLGNVATASQSTPRTESVVLYRPGQSRQARAVARKLDISQIEPLSSTDPSAALAGAANVVVIVGADKSATQ
jgi:LytR cell envelope-related transcriptional attenuator